MKMMIMKSVMMMLQTIPISGVRQLVTSGGHVTDR